LGDKDDIAVISGHGSPEKDDLEPKKGWYRDSRASTATALENKPKKIITEKHCAVQRSTQTDAYNLHRFILFLAAFVRSVVGCSRSKHIQIRIRGNIYSALSSSTLVIMADDVVRNFCVYGHVLHSLSSDFFRLKISNATSSEVQIPSSHRMRKRASFERIGSISTPSSLFHSRGAPSPHPSQTPISQDS
jgi:hypothetical protein